MGKYPNTRLELVEQWLSDIKILKEKINQRANDKCMVEEKEASRISNFVERCALEFELFSEVTYKNRIEAIKGENEYNDNLAWDDLNILRDYLISYRVSLLEKYKIYEFQILFDLAKKEAKRVQNDDVIEAFENMEIEEITQNRGTVLTRWVSKLNTPVGEIICDKLCDLANSVAEGIATAILNH